jgi:3-oxoacyl-[acyl-carrier protein] reductase
MLLEGKSAIVTGGSQGIGTAASLMLAEEGANVCLTYRSHKEEAEEVAKQIEAMGRKALAVKCDISSFTEAEATVKAALDAFGRIDILVNNAGMNWDGVCWKMTECPAAQRRQVPCRPRPGSVQRRPRQPGRK